MNINILLFSINDEIFSTEIISSCSRPDTSVHKAQSVSARGQYNCPLNGAKWDRIKVFLGFMGTMFQLNLFNQFCMVLIFRGESILIYIKLYDNINYCSVWVKAVSSFSQP